ncbi:proline-rich proteoglycan 2-like [Equus asinus]|uniref:proline-rich proteoglycan 2-like n=1 Tax=Equus asinus TaxID=9793 RepID=UPI0038F69DB5
MKERFRQLESTVHRLLGPKAAEAAATRGGERRPTEPPLHLYPPAPGAAGRRAPRDLGAVVPAHSARGPEAGRPRESDPARPDGATATPGARRTAPRGPPPDPRAAVHPPRL